MKAATFYAPGDIRLEDIAEPQVGPGELKIRVRNCSTCGTDVKIARSGHPNMSAPQVMGHEIAGEITDVGAGVEGWAPGWSALRTSRVFMLSEASCRTTTEGFSIGLFE